MKVRQSATLAKVKTFVPRLQGGSELQRSGGPAGRSAIARHRERVPPSEFANRSRYNAWTTRELRSLDATLLRGINFLLLSSAETKITDFPITT